LRANVGELRVEVEVPVEDAVAVLHGGDRLPVPVMNQRPDELIGLAPLAAFLAVADRADAPEDDPVEARLVAAAAYIRLRDFSPLQALELRLAAAEADPVA